MEGTSACLPSDLDPDAESKVPSDVKRGVPLGFSPERGIGLVVEGALIPQQTVFQCFAGGELNG